ncbi:hypothetical protein [Brevibacterium otitidis]|uniref:Uncharacterized protein n=1 Tax=Brevibacterium otitidis TaxID=53364 RepID=A0ABV5WXT6_9MICO|nr:hypothetical protein GCM10023233_34750 [Brevibacterium otitidis]
MRYVVAMALAALAVLGIHWAVGLGSLPRPWGALTLGTIAGVVMVGTLIIWEIVSPSEDNADRDKRIAVEEAAKDEQRELRRAQREASRSARRGEQPEPRADEQAEPGADAQAKPGEPGAGRPDGTD